MHFIYNFFFCGKFIFQLSQWWKNISRFYFNFFCLHHLGDEKYVTTHIACGVSFSHLFSCCLYIYCSHEMIMLIFCYMYDYVSSALHIYSRYNVEKKNKNRGFVFNLLIYACYMYIFFNVCALFLVYTKSNLV